MIAVDGPASARFAPLPLGGLPWRDLETLTDEAALSADLRAALVHAPRGDAVCWGIPFGIRGAAVLADAPLQAAIAPARAPWLVFLHASDARPLNWNAQGFVPASTGQIHLNEPAARYVVLYADGSEEAIDIRRGRQIGPALRPWWGVNCLESVAHRKPRPLPSNYEQATTQWGESQYRVAASEGGPWHWWLYAWPNPHPERAIVGLLLEPAIGAVLFAGVTAGCVTAHPLRWETRRKALLTLPDGATFDPTLDERGLLAQIRLDLGQVISARPRLIYPQAFWGYTYNNQLPVVSPREIVVEYAAHPEAAFHLGDGRVVPEAAIAQRDACLSPIAPATQRVTLRVVESGSTKPVPVKLHVHGQAGEYLPPVDRHRLPNPAWFEDYSVDFTHRRLHHATYIDGETTIDLPLGRVYIEVSKGFEIKPLRLVREVTPETREITIALQKVLPWRERGWVTADTHVHFLSPMSALLEGAAEGVNVVNLLASQWGELMTNVGDFDGRTTWGSREAGGGPALRLGEGGEHLVRVGTENRQHIMGHISLLGYQGRIIAPMTTGGPDESALGDPLEILLTEWARQCHQQGGLVILPHFPTPRAENAATIVEGEADGVEMTSWGDLYSGINPYSLSDWYRYLNNGYHVPAVGGTDKMEATTAIGTVRTYARLRDGEPFTYSAWMDAVRRGETFVTYGPLLDMTVDGQAPSAASEQGPGGRISMSATGGTVDVAWEIASVTVPMSRIELLVNGEIVQSLAVDPWAAQGSFRVPIARSSWIALLVRGHYADKPEIIAAHSSAVLVEVARSPFYAAADAVTILEQIEGTLAYLDTLATRADTQAYRRMRLVLESAHRRLHNRMHAQGHYHEHTPAENHKEHHGG